MYFFDQSHLISIFVHFQVDEDAQDDATADLKRQKDKKVEIQNVKQLKYRKPSHFGDTWWRKPKV